MEHGCSHAACVWWVKETQMFSSFSLILPPRLSFISYHPALPIRISCSERVCGSAEGQIALGSCLCEVTGSQSSQSRHQEWAGCIKAECSLERTLYCDGGWEGSKAPGHLTVPPDGNSTAVVGAPQSTWTPRFPASPTQGFLLLLLLPCILLQTRYCPTYCKMSGDHMLVSPARSLIYNVVTSAGFACDSQGLGF